MNRITFRSLTEIRAVGRVWDALVDDKYVPFFSSCLGVINFFFKLGSEFPNTGLYE